MASSSSQDQFQVPIFGVEAQSLIACNQRLQELGIQDTIQLPRIVVIGDQSTGKSSLIEAISNIEVPKKAGLCTKCPIAINLTSGGSTTAPWSCNVYVENQFFYDANNPKRTKVTSKNPMGPWKMYTDPKPPTKVGTIYNKQELADLIDQAQRMVLNPNRMFESDKMDLAEDRLEKFSPNPIRLDISVADCPNLSFVDLPGVIQTAGQGQPKYLVELVENLAIQHAKDENNIILLTLPINHDVSNSKSYSIIETERAQSRTMAVFTKVDIAREEERNQCVEKYFSNKADEEFQHGHHLVMLAESPTAVDTMNNSRPDEIQFFLHEPWISLPENIRTRLGTHNLVSLLRRILFQKTAETLPASLNSISLRLEEVNDQLSTMPTPPDVVALPYQLREQLYIFQHQASQLFNTAETASSGRNKLVKLMEEFNARILRDRPTMLVRVDAEAKALSDAQHQLQTGSNLPEDDDSEPNSPRPVKGNTTTRAHDNRIQRFRLEDIRELNKRHYRGSIPGQIEPSAVDAMNVLSVQFWNKTLSDFMHRVLRLINQEVLQCVDEVFGHQKHLQLYSNIVESTKAYLDVTIMEHWSLLERRYDTEKATPFTFNQDALKSVEDKVLETRRAKRKEFRIELAQAQQKANHAQQGTGRQGKLADEKSIGADPWDLEVQMSAKSRAYYDVAAHRFIDNVCQEVLCFLIPCCHQKLVDHIKHELGLDNIPANQERIAIMMAEDPERESLRARLHDEFNRLTEGRNYINQILGSGMDSDQSVFDNNQSSSAGLTGNGFKEPVTPGKRKLDHPATAWTTPSKRPRSENGAVNGYDSPTPGASQRGLAVRLQSVELEEEMDQE